ncbi:MAG TPA: ATPase domain-containing protein [Candidatus Nitrosopolaris sp.]|nr:ATPase domain-containing protein [Candidatus Nitrosopolaris sp.]
MQIPGVSHLVEGSLPNSLLLLIGPVGSGKTMYCRQFFIDGLDKGDHCIYFSSTLSENQYKNLFASRIDLHENSVFINPYLIEGQESEKLGIALGKINAFIDKMMINRKITTNCVNTSNAVSTNNDTHRTIVLIIDSLTHLFAIFGEGPVINFVTQLYFLLKKIEGKAIFTLTTPSPNEYVTLSSILDGVLEMKLQGDNVLTRNIRMLSIKGLHNNPSWIDFTISNDGSLIFADRSASLHCYLCQKPILDVPIMHAGFPFHDYHVETYKKLAGVYGLNISEIGISSEVVDANFFYIDIVGLSNPSLSVSKQREKIENLFGIIKSCDAFKSDDLKIHLPTGDGMVIGFLLNPQLPLELGTQLHRKLRLYNKSKESPDDFIGVRIGLSSGPVFAVNDIKNNQNFWGPGIILARRVMEMGNNWHILLADVLAEKLIPLRGEYRKIIKSIGSYSIKHGQEITLYSAYSNEFGNPDSPPKRDLVAL